MALFVIYGVQNSGKTHAAWLIYNLLKVAGIEIQSQSLTHPQQKWLTHDEVLQHIEDRFNAPQTTGHISDFRALFEYNGKKVALFSAGDYVHDPNWVVTSFDDNMDWAKKMKVDHVICCSRYNITQGGVRKYILDNYKMSVYRWYYKSRLFTLPEQLADAQRVAINVFTNIQRDC